jgi:hypothetical protein
MPIEPREVWRSLPEALRRAIAEDLAQVLREVSHGLGARQTGSPEPQSVCAPVNSPPGDHQSREPEAPIRSIAARARELGWRETDIDVIDADLGQSGAAAAHRKGFKDLVARVTLGEVGLILSIAPATARIGIHSSMSVGIVVV